MSESFPIYDYVRVALIRLLKTEGWPDSFQRKEFFRDRFKEKYLPIVVQFDSGVSQEKLSVMVDNVFEELVEQGVFSPLDGGVAGSYYRFVPEALKNFINSTLAGSSIFKIGRQVGLDRYFADVFEVTRNSPHLDGGFSDEFSMRDFDTGPNIVIPASDRLVTLGHNQQTELEASTTAVIASLEKENSIGGDAETRSWMLGRLKAARELIRAGSLHVWLMQATILNVLHSLIANYKDHAIGAAASVLLELLIKHLFGIS